MLTLFLGELCAMSFPRRVTLLLAGFAWALVTNVGRTVALALIAARSGQATLEHWHDTAGYTVLALCAAGVSLTAWVLQRVAARPAAPALDFPALLPRFRPAALPSAIGLALLVAGLAGTETWFQMHERSVVPLASWQFRLPADRPAFRASEISSRVRTELRFDTGYSGQWKDPAGRRWQAMYFQWVPGKNAVQTVVVHDPRTCLAASGLQEIAVLPPVVFEHDGLQLPFDAYHFRDGTQEVFVFNCVVEDVRRDELQSRVREDNSIASRFAVAFAGKRHRGQRRLEVAVWGAPDPATAKDLFRELLKTQVEIGAPAGTGAG